MIKPSQELVDAVTKLMIEEGKVIEAGFQGFCLYVFPQGAPQFQLDEMRNAYFAGAQNLYASLIRTMDGGDEPTGADFHRMEMVARELDLFIREFELRHVKTEGRA